MHVELKIYSYRCFGPDPVSLHLRDGFTALVGLNNGGKTTLLRLLYELRDAFRSGVLPNAIRGSDVHWSGPMHIASGERIWRAGTEEEVKIVVIPHDVHGVQGFRVNNSTLGYEMVVGRDTRLTASVVAGQQRFSYRDVSQWIDLAMVAAACRALFDTLYVGPFRNAIAPGGGNYYDLVTGEAFVETFRRFKSGASPEQNEAVVLLQDELARIFGFSRLDINPSNDGKSLQVNVDGRSFRLSELGSGLSHFIVVLVNVLVKRPSFLLIDEPELNLHASLQLDFLTTLGRYTTTGVVFATHSMGLARTAAEHVYVVNHHAADGRQVAEYESGAHLATLAGQLSFDGTPEVGYKKVLLVEGRSEVRAVMQLLRLYAKEHAIALIPLGGGEMLGADTEVELRELMRLGPVSYLIDSERTSAEGAPQARHQQFADLCESLGIPGHMLDRRAFENYLPQHALDKAFGDGKVRALTPFAGQSAGAGWRKTHNWQVTAHMTRADLDGTDLGTFLESL